jgi:PAS domain S-box-containing protein
VWGTVTESESVAAARTVTVDEALKERAMDEAPVGITISDPSLPDNPLVYVNDEYERLTGYSREEVLGRNCRLLQGPDTSEAPVAAMRDAIDAGEPVSVELRNYRKDGSEFWNRVDVAPIYEDGEVANFVGFQTDVTRRVLAEQAARQRAHEVREERQSLERVLDRVSGLLADVTGALVNSTTRADLERAVCRRVSSADPYAFAWVGEYDAVEEAVTPAVGVTENGTEVTDFDLAFGRDDPVERAVADGAVTVVEAADRPDGLHGEGWPDRYESMAAVPLAYREAVYGVLCVYATTTGAFDDKDRVLLGAIGRATATGINAVESHRRVATDERAELEFDVTDTAFFPAVVAAAFDCELEYVGAERSDVGTLALLFDVTGFDGDPDAVAETADGVAAATVVADHSNGTLFEFDAPDGSLVSVLAERGATVESIDATPDDVRVVVDAPGDTDPRSVADAVTDYYPGAELAAVRQHAAQAVDDRPASGVTEELTDRQRAVLRRANAAGFFAPTRAVSGEELAASMDLSSSTFHEHLRAALRKVVDEVTDSDPLDRTPT